MSDLIKFLEGVKPIYKMKLPFFHTCTFNEGTAYAERDKIDLKFCDVFKKNLVYLFLGKGRYVVRYENATVKFVPVSFVLKPDAIFKVYKTFPFDTGACALGFYSPVIPKERIDEVKEHFDLGTDLAIGYALITYFFKSLIHYIREKPKVYSSKIIKQTVIESSAYQLEDINALYGTSYTPADGRKVTVEIVSNKAVDLPNNAVCLLLPSKNYFTNQKFKDFCKRNNVRPQIYAGKQQLASDRYYGRLLEKAEQIALRYVA